MAVILFPAVYDASVHRKADDQAGKSTCQEIKIINSKQSVYHEKK